MIKLRHVILATSCSVILLVLCWLNFQLRVLDRYSVLRFVAAKGGSVLFYSDLTVENANLQKLGDATPLVYHAIFDEIYTVDVRSSGATADDMLAGAKLIAKLNEVERYYVDYGCGPVDLSEAQGIVEASGCSVFVLHPSCQKTPTIHRDGDS